jgi:hypothetical protein
MIKQTFKRKFRLGIVMFAAVFLTAAGALQLTAEEQKLDAKKKTGIINKVAAALNDHYVFPDAAKKMETHLRKQLKKGAYKQITDPVELAEVLTKDLRDICHDLHLRVRYYPDPPRQRSPKPEDLERRLRQAKFDNFAFREVKRLTGNIGYLKLDNFLPAEYGGDIAVGAMNFLANTYALIIDLRENTGGSPSMIQLISSYFFKDSVHLNSFYIREGNKTRQFWTPEHVEGPRMTDVDIYVLTSKRTFSAAEEFTYNLKNMERATIVGETTGGGAHPVKFHYLEDVKFGMGIPYGRAVNPITNTNWEGTGIKPHVEVPKEQAFDKAYDMALKKLSEKADDEKKKWIEGEFNVKGYRLMNAGKIKEAVKVFKKNVELFPQSANVYDSLGEACMKNDEKELAVKNYKKSLELDPKNKNALKMLKKLEE